MVDVGSQAPSFTLRNHVGGDVSLDNVAPMSVLLYWYPKADTPGCTAQAQGLRDQREAFEQLGCTVLGASFDPVEDLAAFHSKYQLNFDLLSDPSRQVGRLYGVAGEDGGGEYASRVAFLIDHQGIVVRRYEVETPEMFAEQVLDDLEAS